MQPAVQQTLTDLKTLVDGFGANAMANGKAMRQQLGEEFFESALPFLRQPTPDSPGYQYLLTLLLTHDMLLPRLSDPTLFTLDEAVALGKCLRRIDPLIDIKLLKNLLEGKDTWSRQEMEERANSAAGIRLLEILAGISESARILPMMTQLLRHPNSRVRSKAALLVGRGNKNHKWVEQKMGETDARVRANAVESLWGVDSEGSRAVFWNALADSDNRVVGNALLGLYRLGEPASIALLLQMAEHPQDDFRISAVWVMAEAGDPRFLQPLARMMRDPGAKIRASVFRAIAQIKQNKNRLLARPRLATLMGAARSGPDGWIDLAAAVCSTGAEASAQGVTGLKPTNFVLFEDHALVTDYEVQERTHGEALAVALALPLAAEGDIYEQAVRRGLTHKRRLDSWTVLKYSEEAEPDSGEPSEPAEQRFSTDPAAIAGSVSAPTTRRASAHGMLHAVRVLVGTLAQVRGARRLVLLADAPLQPLSPAVQEELLRAASAPKIALHVVAPAWDAELAALCVKTGGELLIAHDAAELARVFEYLCAGWLAQYRIRFQSSGGARVAIEIYSEQGFAEQTWTVVEREAAAKLT